jgi:hypothetical protein
MHHLYLLYLVLCLTGDQVLTTSSRIKNVSKIVAKNRLNALRMITGEEHLSNSNRIRYVSRVMYDGSSFKGWQEQRSSMTIRTVQAIIGKQLSSRFNTPIRVTGASRTDLGVHARGQALHFDLPKPCDDLKYLEFTLNRMLPDDVRLFNIADVPLGTLLQVQQGEPWHSTKSAIGKLYVYRYINICLYVFLYICINLKMHIYMNVYFFMAFINTSMHIQMKTHF